MAAHPEVRGRRRRTPEQRQALLARYHESHLTQAEFAARHRLGLSTLGKWLGEEGSARAAPVKFQEVRLPSASNRWLVEVVSPQGWTLRFAQVPEVDRLPAWLRGLPC
jgi:transposase-like protein